MLSMVSIKTSWYMERCCESFEEDKEAGYSKETKRKIYKKDYIQ